MNNKLTIGKLILNEHDFYHPRHRMLWRSLKELYTNNQTMDIMLLVDYLNKENRLAAMIACTSLMENDSVNNLKSPFSRPSP